MSGAAVIVLTGILVGVACAVPGCFLVLRRQSMLGDAISHAALLGIVAAYWLTGGKNPLAVLAAATLAGVLTAALVAAVRRSGLAAADAAIGLVFPAMFAIGVIAISRMPPTLHLDVEHVLFGEIAYAPLDVARVAGVDLGYRSLWTAGAMAALNLALAALFFKELQLTTFDAELARTQGFRPDLVGLGLTTATAATVTVAFDSVGSILAIGMLIVPAATAWLLTDDLARMIGAACATSALAAATGYLAARAIDGSIAGAMVAAAGVLFMAALVFGPKHGLLARRMAGVRLAGAR
ncbi:MAG: metal ABC transporter permease [Chloroflexota bacterium]